MDPQKKWLEEKRLAEWKTRYECFHHLLTQYISVMSIAGTIWLIATGIVIAENTPDEWKILGFIFLIVSPSLLAIGIIIARQTTKILFLRLKELERNLAFEEYPSTNGMIKLLNLGLFICISFAFVMLCISVCACI